ncbi:MAG: OmpA family protein [Proteobacteria bacterium]|nr:OmpA family protein [Pseudomonadota bacterium]
MKAIPFSKKLLTVVLLFSFAVCDARKSKPLEYASLEKDYNNLINDEKYKPYAKAEKKSAKKRIEALMNGQVKRKNVEQAVYVARNKIAYARLAAECSWIINEIKLEQEKAHKFEVSISKTQATIARHDAQVARMMLIAQQEESQRAKDRADQAELIAQNSIEQANLSKKESEAAKRYAQAQAEEASLAKQEAELAIEEAESLRRKLNSIATEQTDKGLMMTLGDFVFDSGKSTIKQDAVENFSKVIDFINTYPSNNVRIEGHTDSSGSNQLNVKLSQRRADAVKALLVKNGIGANQIEALGMGEEFPIAENTTHAGKAKNRRVEIIILR